MRPEFAPQVDVLLNDCSRRLVQPLRFAQRLPHLIDRRRQQLLAHATFLSGLWINNQQRHDTLVASDRTT